MDWHYAVSNKQQGPVSTDQLLELHRKGIVNATTMVWRPGMSVWQPYATISDQILAPGYGICADCGKSLPLADLMQLGANSICAGCKPMYLQRLKEGVTVGGSKLWRAGKKLIMAKDAEMPDRCVKCNAPGDGRKLKRKFFWHSPFIYLTIILSLPIYVIFALVAGKKATLQVGICEKHRAARRKAIWIALGVFGSAILLLAGAIMYDNGWLGIAGFVVLIASLIYGVVGPRVVYASRIDKEHIWLGGVCQEYLVTLPEWPGKNG